MSSSEDDAPYQEAIGLSLASAFVLRRPGRATLVKTKAGPDWKPKSKLLTSLTRKFEERIIAIQEIGYREMLEDLTNFVRGGTKETFGYVPTAIAKLGVNIADNEVVFDLISSKLEREKVSRDIIRFNAQDVSSMTSIVTKLTETLLNEDVIAKMFGSKAPKRAWFQSLTYSSLMKIYNQQNKKKSDLPLVIMIQEIDRAGANSGLRQLFPVIRDHLETFPVVLICGTFTDAVSLQHLLPAKATDCIFVKSFESRASAQLFEEIMSNVIIASDIATFKCGPSIIELLADNFQNHDMSVRGVTDVLNMCLFKHFFTNPLTSKLNFKGILRISEGVNRLTKEELAEIIVFIKKVLSKSGAPIPKSSDELRHYLESSLRDLSVGHSNFVSSLRHIYLLMRDLPERPLGSSFSSFYVTAFQSESFLETDECKKAFSSFRFLAMDEMKTLLETCVNNSPDTYSSYPTIFEEHLDSLNKLQHGGGGDELTSKAAITINLTNIKSRADLQSKLKANIAPRPRTRFEVWRDDFIFVMKKEIANMTSPMFMPLYELVYFNDADYIRRRCFPSPRTGTIKLLKNPRKELKLSQPDESELDDVARIFNLYSQSAVSINLHDFLDAFKAQAETAHYVPKKKKGKGVLATEEQKRLVRFFSVIEDFEYTGFVQKNKRKCDHLTKLVWE